MGYSASISLCVFAVVLLSPLTQTPASSQPVGSDGTTLKGYKFSSDVAEHAKIDLDQAQIEEFTDAGKWSDANLRYSNGGNSKKSDKLRTIKGFSTDAPKKMVQEGYYQVFKNYWGDATYADTFTSNGLNAGGDFSGKENEFLAEVANKGAQYQNVWMYVIHEMEDSIDDCTKGSETDNDKGVKAWDEAWAFYTGSMLGGEGDAQVGKLLYTLAQKRCTNFGTCKTNPDGAVASVNQKILDLFQSGQKKLTGKDCPGLVDVKNEIVQQMTVPVMQGIIRYAYLTKKAVQDDREIPKNHGEGWAFSAAILPLIHECDSGVAEMLWKNFGPKEKPMGDDPKDVVNRLAKTYRCLGFECTDIGELESEKDYPECKASGSKKKIRGTDQAAVSNTDASYFKKEVSSKNSPGDRSGGGKISTGAVVGIVIGVLLLALIVVGLFFYRRSKKAKVVLPTGGEEGGTFA